MSVDACGKCGSVRVRPAQARVANGTRRRRYVCMDCEESFTTLEVRLPPGLEVPVLQAKLKEWINKEAS